jgi:hypothetical protein
VKKFLRWVNSTLLGHIAYYGSIFTVAFSVSSIYQNFTQHTLTLSRALFIVVGCAVVGVACAIIIWFAISLPRMKRD